MDQTFIKRLRLTSKYEQEEGVIAVVQDKIEYKTKAFETETMDYSHTRRKKGLTKGS